jgi:hypothetical protein
MNPYKLSPVRNWVRYYARTPQYRYALAFLYEYLNPTPSNP